MSAPRRRFYRDVSIGTADGRFTVRLDGRSVKTPAGALLILPNEPAAVAVAEEWRSQADTIRHEAMVLTKLANTAIDRIAGNREAVQEQILAYARADLLCYRAEANSRLAERQAQAWNPLLAWAASTHGVTLKTQNGIAFVPQGAEAIEALRQTLASKNDFVLAGVHAATTLCGSAIVALALAEGHLDAAAAFAAAHVDEIYQTEQWGEDAEAAAKAKREQAELVQVARFLVLAGDKT